MPAKRLSMRKIKEVLRLKWSKRLSNRRIASSCGIARPTVSEYLRRAESARLTWPLPASLDDTRLERLLFPPPPHLPAPVRGIPDWARAHQELKQKGVTLFLLWQEIGPPIQTATCGVRIAIHGTNAELIVRSCDTSSDLTTIQRQCAISLFYSFTWS